MNYHLRSKQTKKYIVEKDYCVLVECKFEEATEWTLEAAKQAIEFDNDLYKEPISEDRQILLASGILQDVAGYDLEEFEAIHGIKLFYFKDESKLEEYGDLYTITEKSSGIKVITVKDITKGIEDLSDKLLNESFKEKFNQKIKEHFDQKYFMGKKVKMLNGTAGGMFKEKKV